MIVMMEHSVLTVSMKCGKLTLYLFVMCITDYLLLIQHKA